LNKVSRIGGLRRYDIKQLGPPLINFEFKAWFSQWRAATFRTQYIKDLQKMISLGDVKWIFANSDIVPNMLVLRESVLNSLGTFNTVTNNWVASDELAAILNNSTVRSRLEDVFDLNEGFTSNDITKFVDKLKDYSFTNQEYLGRLLSKYGVADQDQLANLIGQKFNEIIKISN